MAEEKVRVSGELSRPAADAPVLPTSNPDLEKKTPPAEAGLPAAAYVIFWISLSGGVILFNKWILSTLKFKYPILLTAWHLTFSTIMTQILARTTTLLDGRKKVKMTGRVYLRAIVPIGLAFSLSLMCGNMTYLYLSVSFIQMLKATMPVAVLITSWVLRVEEVNFMKLFNVSFIVLGVVIASFGEIDFVLAGFLYQLAGLIFEALRINLVQTLLNGAEYKMDPLVSLYYFAPVCAVMNTIVALFLEVPQVTMEEFNAVGIPIFIANAGCAFLLNVAVVFLIGKTSGLVLTLCGVLKDILLVIASVLIWGTMISNLQMFGYSIALLGMLWFKFGKEKIKEYLTQGGRAWAEFGATRPALRKVLILGLVVVTIFVLLGGLAPSYDLKSSIDAARGAVGA